MDYDKSAPGGMRLTPDQILKRQATAQAKKDEFQQLYQDAYEFALPQRQLYGVWEGGATGSKKMQRVFDSTAINSTQRFANRLQSVVFPPQRKWAKLEAGSDIPPERRQQAQAVLEVYQEKMFTMLNQSNFDIAKMPRSKMTWPGVLSKSQPMTSSCLRPPSMTTSVATIATM